MTHDYGDYKPSRAYLRALPIVIALGLLGGIGLGLILKAPEAIAQSSGQPVRVYKVNTSGNWIPSPLTGIDTGYSVSNITTATTTTVKTGGGMIHCVSVNTGGTTATATLYNNTAGSGTKIGTVTITTAGVNVCPDAAFTIGLTVVTTGSPAADITVTYR